MNTLFIRFNPLGSGYVHGFDYRTGESGLWCQDGTPHSGELARRYPQALAQRLNPR